MSAAPSENQMKSLYHKIGLFVLKYRWAIILSNIALLVVVTAAMVNRGKEFGEHVAYMKELRNNPMAFDSTHKAPPPIFNADYHVFFKSDNRDLMEYDELQKVFVKEDNLIIVVQAKNGDLFTQENLASIKEITDKSWSVPYVNRVDGLTNFNYTTVDEDDMLVEDFIDEVPETKEELGRKKHLALNDSLMPHFLISKKADLTQISLRVIAPPEFETALEEAQKATVFLTNEILSGYSQYKKDFLQKLLYLNAENVQYKKTAAKLAQKLQVRFHQDVVDKWTKNPGTLDEFFNSPLLGTIHEKVDALKKENKELDFEEAVNNAVDKNLDADFETMYSALKSQNLDLSLPELSQTNWETHSQLAQKPNNNLDIKLGGTVMLNNAFKEYAQNDMQTLIPVMFLIIMVFLGVTLRSSMSVFLPMILLFTAIVFPIFLFVGAFDRYLTNVSMNVMQMLVAVAIADSVHILAVFYRGLRNGLDKKQSVVLTVEKNFLPCLITSVTTAIGFYSLVFQDIPPFNDLGIFAGTGTIYAFFASVFTLPAFLSLLPFRTRVHKDAHEKLKKPAPIYIWIAHFVTQNQKSIRWVAGGLTVISLALMLNIHVDSNAVKYFSPTTSFRQATEFIDANIIGTNALELRFQSGEENGVYDPEFLLKIEKFANFIKAHPEFEITYVSSIADVVKRLNQTMHGDDPGYYSIPFRDSVIAEGDTLFARNLIAQYMLLYTMSLPQGMEITNQVNLDNSEARVVAFIRSVSSGRQLEIIEEINQWLEKNMPETAARGLGVPVMFGKLMDVAIPGMLVSLGISFVFITLVLMATFRSVKIGLFSMIPNVWPIIIIFGLVGAVGYTVNLSVAVVGMITLGICVDDSVHFLVKYLNAIKEGHRGEHAFTEALNQVGAPILFTSIILVMGFGALIFSDFALNSDMGMLCSAVIALAVVADFILLPATILKFHKIPKN